MAERRDIGSVKTFEQAVYRLPPDYDPRFNNDEMICHLMNLRASVEKGFNSQPALGQHDLESRMVPLTQEDIARMERDSFKRDLNNPLAWSYGFVRPENYWSMIFDSGDDAYATWRVTKLVPYQYKTGGMLSCIETHPHMYRNWLEIPKYSEDVEYNVGWIKNDELYELISEVTRFEVGLS